MYGYIRNICIISIIFLPVLLNGQVDSDAIFSQCSFSQTENNIFTCYKLINGKFTINDAEAQCSDLHPSGRLLSIRSAATHQSVRNLLINQAVHFIWLGLKEVQTPWQWTYEKEVTRFQGCYKDDPTKPDLEIRTYIVNNSYSECIRHCKNNGKVYAGVQNKIECWCGDTFGRYEQVNECNLLCPGNSEEICGGNKANIILKVDGAYSNWENGQPNNHTGLQNCACQDGRNYGYLWNDERCSAVNYAMCQFEHNETECNMTNMTWIGNTCYNATPRAMTHFQANYWCLTHHGELATYGDTAQEEEVMLYMNATFYKKNMWLGLTRSQWQWSRGEEMTFAGWNSGEPNGGLIQACVKMDQDGTWRDVDCGGQANIVCQLDNGTIPTEAVTIPTEAVTIQSTTVSKKKKVPTATLR